MVSSRSNGIYEVFRWYFTPPKYHRNDCKVSLLQLQGTSGTTRRWRCFQNTATFTDLSPIFTMATLPGCMLVPTSAAPFRHTALPACFPCIIIIGINYWEDISPTDVREILLCIYTDAHDIHQSQIKKFLHTFYLFLWNFVGWARLSDNNRHTLIIRCYLLSF